MISRYNRRPVSHKLEMWVETQSARSSQLTVFGGVRPSSVPSQQVDRHWQDRPTCAPACVHLEDPGSLSHWWLMTCLCTHIMDLATGLQQCSSICVVPMCHTIKTNLLYIAKMLHTALQFCISKLMCCVVNHTITDYQYIVRGPVCSVLLQCKSNLMYWLLDNVLCIGLPVVVYHGTA